MPLLLFLTACELFRGPWGGWVLFGDGELQALDANEVPAVLDADAGVLTDGQADALFDGDWLPWHEAVVVDGRGLLVHVDETTWVATFYDVQGTVLHEVHDVVLDDGWGTNNRQNIARQLALGIDTAGGLVMLHPLPTDQQSEGRMRLHRESGGAWTWTDLETQGNTRYRGRLDQLTAHGDQVAWSNGDAIITYDATTLAEDETLRDAESLIFDGDTLVRVGRDVQTYERVVQRGACQLTLEDGHHRLVPGPGGGIELFSMDRYSNVSRTPLTDACEFGEPRVTWPQGYAYRDVAPRIWGGDGVLAAAFDIDPVYDHPAPSDSPWDIAVQDGFGDTGY